MKKLSAQKSAQKVKKEKSESNHLLRRMVVKIKLRVRRILRNIQNLKFPYSFNELFRFFLFCIKNCAENCAKVGGEPNSYKHRSDIKKHLQNKILIRFLSLSKLLGPYFAEFISAIAGDICENRLYRKS